MLLMITAQCLAHDLHTIAHWSVCVGDSLQGSEEIGKNLELHLSVRSLLLSLLLFLLLSASGYKNPNYVQSKICASKV